MKRSIPEPFRNNKDEAQLKTLEKRNENLLTPWSIERARTHWREKNQMCLQR